MWESLNDDDLDDLRQVEKVKVSGTRLKAKHGLFMEQQFELSSERPDFQFRLYRRHHISNKAVFSVGLQALIEGQWLTLCRYNGPYHAHRNEIERNRLVDTPHIHRATTKYIREASHPDGFAESTDRYTDVEGAWSCILADCNVHGVPPSSNQPQDDDPNFRLDF